MRLQSGCILTFSVLGLLENSSGNFLRRAEINPAKDLVRNWLKVNGGLDLMKEAGVVSALQEIESGAKKVVGGYEEAYRWAPKDFVRQNFDKYFGSNDNAGPVERKVSFLPAGTSSEDGILLVDPEASNSRTGWLNLENWSVLEESKSKDSLESQLSSEVEWGSSTDFNEIHDSSNWFADPLADEFLENVKSMPMPLEQNEVVQLSSTPLMGQFLPSEFLPILGQNLLPSELTPQVFQQGSISISGQPILEFQSFFGDETAPTFDPWKDFTFSVLHTLQEPEDLHDIWSLSIVDKLPSFEVIDVDWKPSNDDFTVGDLRELLFEVNQPSFFDQIFSQAMNVFSRCETMDTDDFDKLVFREQLPEAQHLPMIAVAPEHVWGQFDSPVHQLAPVSNSQKRFVHSNTPKNEMYRFQNFRNAPTTAARKHNTVSMYSKAKDSVKSNTGFAILHLAAFAVCVIAVVGAMIYSRQRQRSIQAWEKEQFNLLHEALIARTEEKA